MAPNQSIKFSPSLEFESQASLQKDRRPFKICLSNISGEETSHQFLTFNLGYPHHYIGFSDLKKKFFVIPSALIINVFSFRLSHILLPEASQ